MMKRSLLMFLSLLVLFCGCQNGKKEVFESEIYYEGDFVSVKTVEKLEEPERCETLWMPVDYNDAFLINDVIFIGVIEKATEVKIGSNKTGTHTQAYKTILEVSVNEVIKDTNNTIGDKKVIKVLTGVTSRRYETNVAAIVEGQEYLLLTRSSSSLEKDSMGISEYTDTFISSPMQYIVPIIDGKICEVRGFYSDLCENKCKMTNIKSVVANLDSYREIISKIGQRERSDKYTDIVKVNDVDIKIDDLLQNVSNKYYYDESEVEMDLDLIYLVSKKELVECISEYIENNKIE